MAERDQDNGSTPATTALVLREISSAVKVVDGELKSQQRAVEVLQAQANRSPSVGEVDLKVDSLNKLFDLYKEFAGLRNFVGEKVAEVLALKEVIDGKFDKVGTQISERDNHVKEAAVEVKSAIIVGLTSQKEIAAEQQKASSAAITKSEDGFHKEIDGMKEIFTASIKALETQVNDLKGRVNSNDSRGQGASQNAASIIAIVVAVAVVVGVVVAVITLAMHK